MTKSFGTYADHLKLLAHPARLELVHVLRDQALFVQDLQLMLGKPQAFVSQQLQLLRRAGVVATERAGRRVAYKLANPAIIRGSDLLRQAFGLSVADHGRKRAVFQDPVCGMRLAPHTAAFRFVFRREPYYFCASGCLHRFRKAPHHFLTRP